MKLIDQNLVFLHINNKLLYFPKRKLEKSIPFTIASNGIKFLDIYLTKEFKEL